LDFLTDAYQLYLDLNVDKSMQSSTKLTSLYVWAGIGTVNSTLVIVYLHPYRERERERESPVPSVQWAWCACVCEWENKQQTNNSTSYIFVQL